MDLLVGIDKKAHEYCLKAGGKTIAVLGGGFENLYPKENIKLLYKILDNDGLIVTEYAPSIPCFKYNFVARNRIIAALSRGIIVIEARENSGSLITANYGFELKRNVFSCPGNVYNNKFKGSNRLLVEGAKCILSANDVIKYYPQIKFEHIKKKEKVVVPEEYKKIYNIIKKEDKNIDELTRVLNMSINELNSRLVLMEIERFYKKRVRKYI